VVGKVRLRRLQMRRMQMRLETLLGLWRLRRLLRALGTLPLVLDRHRPTTLTEANTNGRVLLDPVSFCFDLRRGRQRIASPRRGQRPSETPRRAVERVDKS
jgi:hypothetical protein